MSPSGGRRLAADLVVRNAAEIATLAGPVPRLGSDLDRAAVLAGGAVAACAGRIVWVGPEREFEAAVVLAPGGETLDAAGGLVTPGFVDPHTHALFAGYREREFNRLLAGETYADIARTGGGIRATVRSTRAASDAELEQLTTARLDRMLLHGTTTAEVKTGYGLTVAEEMRGLELLRRIARRHPVDLVPTVLAAHAVPPEHDGRPEAWIDAVVGELLPAARGLARYGDVFCDPAGFDPAQSRRVLEAARDLGFGLRVHADEFSASGGAELAAELGAASADHLGGIEPAAIDRLAAARVTAVLLPGTLFFLGIRRYAPARALVAGGVAVALGTDLNPGTSHTESMGAILPLACLNMRLTIDEALAAATVNAAHSLGLGADRAILEPGRRADLVVHDVPNRYHLVYHWGVNHVRHVVAGGKVVVRDGRLAGPRPDGVSAML